MARPDAFPRTVGRYVLHRELAAGGMATVHVGRLSGPVGFSRTVAIKRLHPQFAKDPDFVTMFLDEARLCGRIRHPNVVPTLDVVSLDGEIFIVMEYVAGEALSKLVRVAQQKNLPVPPRVAASILSSVLHGLHAAHRTKDEQGRELGIVHRDVSPQNILVGGDGTARVLDFGVAKATGRAQTTKDGQLKGKVAYMPPEQLSGGPVSCQIDIYAAAVVLWETLAGRRLFDGDTEAVVLVRALEGKIDPPSMHRPELSAEVDAVVMRGLRRDPNERYATAREMALAIEQTVGLASPYEVGEWVESIASEELARRARVIAEIESAAHEPRISLAPSAVEPPHSQVSSISVSRPAIPSAQVPARSKLARVLVATAGALGLCGVGLAALAYEDVFGRATARRVANTVVHEERALAVARAPLGTSRSVAPTPVEPVRVTPRPSPAPASVKKPNPCETPYTIDPATGHKKYKMECLGK